MSEQPMTHEVALDLAAGYVLGALEPAEEAAIRAHLLSCPETHDVVADLGGVLPYLAESVEQVEPPASLGDRIMAAAAAELATRAGATRDRLPATNLATSPTAFPGTAERAERSAQKALRGTSRLGWATRIAAVVAIVILGGWNLLLQGDLSSARGFDQAVAAVIGAASGPGSQIAVLTPTTDSRASGIAAVAPDGSVVIAMRDLTATAGAQVYEAWVIVAGSTTPVPVGAFKVGPGGTAAFTTEPVATPPGSTIALSLEPGPGSTTPLGPIVAAGVSTAPRS